MREDQVVRSPVACLESVKFESVRLVESSKKGLAAVKEENEAMSAYARQSEDPEMETEGLVRRTETCERDLTSHHYSHHQHGFDTSAIDLQKVLPSVGDLEER
jgi:hypothetical protein